MDTALRNSYPNLYECVTQKDISVRQAMQQQVWNLNVHGMSEIVQEEHQKLIVQLESRNFQWQEDRDVPKWKWTREGQYTVKSFYYAMQSTPTILTEKSRI